MKDLLTVLTLTALCGAAAVAQTRPNFSGIWELGMLRSRLDPKAGVTGATMKIDHTEPTLKIDMNMQTKKGPRAYIVDLQIDGPETEHSIDGRSCKTVAKWGTRTGERLQLETACLRGTATDVTTREMKLGDKGKILTTIMIAKGESGETRANEFFTKEQEKKR